MDKESSLVEGSIDRIIKFKEQRQKVGKNKHKEEGKGRIKSDMKDRKKSYNITELHSFTKS